MGDMSMRKTVCDILAICSKELGNKNFSCSLQESGKLFNSETTQNETTHNKIFSDSKDLSSNTDF